MNTNFPFRSIHQHIKLHFVSFCLFRRFLFSRCVYLLIYFIDELLLIYLNGNSKMWVLFTHKSLSASQWTQQLTQKVTLNSVQSLLWLSMIPEPFELFAFIYFWFFFKLHSFFHLGLSVGEQWRGGGMAGEAARWRRRREICYRWEYQVHPPRSHPQADTQVASPNTLRVKNQSFYTKPFSDWLLSFPFHSQNLSLVQANPEVAMDSIVHMTQHISPTQRTEVVRILSTMETSASS